MVSTLYVWNILVCDSSSYIGTDMYNKSVQKKMSLSLSGGMFQFFTNTFIIIHNVECSRPLVNFVCVTCGVTMSVSVRL